MESTAEGAKTPGTDAPDGSALALKGIGQFHITMGWVCGIVFLALGISCCTSDFLIVFGIFFIVVAIISIIRGYSRGANAKATAVAAINAKKAAERSARMEQMLVNMVSGAPAAEIPNGRLWQPSSPQSNLADQLRELKGLLDEGLLTKEEFDSQKAKVLAGNSVAVLPRTTKKTEVPEKKTENSVSQKTVASVKMIPIPGQNYMIGAFPVTQDLWVSVMGENPSSCQGDNLPINNVSWDDCQQFLEKLNSRLKVKESGITYRLPTVEEWEFACRADSKGDYCKMADGSNINPDTLERVAWYKGNSDDKLHPVGQKEPNAFGLYDMNGNIWEWTATGTGSSKLFCGGAYNSSFNLCKNTSTNSDYPGYKESNRGIRLAADIV
ncbi:MAG: SUMF1/EgtB/PvdO family nonheme iron enzyme [Kiritimatiellae bacterium]|nr:SUMF1/EgtB/PvdO family nonheme iron enzyme [Kiritimatiellia bacterium]